MKKKKLTGLSLNKKTVSALSKSMQENILGGGTDSCYTGTYPANQCCPGGGGGDTNDCIPATGALAGCKPNESVGITGCV